MARMINLELIREVAAELAPYRDEDEKTYLDTLDGETDAVDILNDLAIEDAQDLALIEANKAAEARIKSRRQRIEMRQETRRRLIGRVLAAAEMRKAELGIATVSVRDGSLSVLITDPEAVPSQLCTVKTVTAPDKAAIKAQILAGEDVPGATLERGGPIVTVKVT